MFKTIEAISEVNLDDVFSGIEGPILVKRYVSPDECRHICTLLDDFPKDSYPQLQSATPVNKIGVSQSQYFGRPDEKQKYLEQSAAFMEHISLHMGSSDLVGRLHKQVTSLMGIQISPIQEFGMLYACGVYRFVSELLLHSDFTPRDAQGWANDHIEAQIAVNIYLSDFSGGETEVYDLLWQPEHEQYKRPLPSYGYFDEVVNNVQSDTVKAGIGDLLFFNSRKFHRVRTVGTNHGKRITLGWFLGQQANSDELICWS